MDEAIYCIGFSHFFGIGPLHFKSLLSVFGSAKQAYSAASADLEKVIGVSLARRFVDYRQHTNLTHLDEEIRKKRIRVLIQTGEHYPESLKALSDPPVCLYVKGESALLRDTANLFAVVGTRNPTAYGAQLARHFAYALAEHGFTIVSGMALGIDALAHRGALDAKGKTIAVLGCGVDLIYPPSHRSLYEQILSTGGAIISEFPPGHTVRRGLFIVRNRLISGLSQGLLVIEGTDRSGTLTTARYAADQGKPVFAPPAPITSIVSQAPNLLLKQGAVLVTDVDDILHEFGMRKHKRIGFDTNRLSAEEKQIVALLQKEDCSIDDIVARLCLGLSVVAPTLSRLEIQNMVEKDDAGRYRLHLD